MPATNMTQWRGRGNFLAIVLFALGGCSSGSSARDGAADAKGDAAGEVSAVVPDAANETTADDAFASDALEAGSSDGAAPDGGGSDGASDGAAPDGGASPALSFVTPEVTVPAGGNVAVCFYFHASNAALGIKQWTSHMDAGGRALTLSVGAATQPADGTQADGGCQLTEGSALTSWLYKATTADATLALPTDDGAGHPLGMAIAASAFIKLEVRYLNSDADSIKVRARVDGHAHADGVAFTRTETFVATNTAIAIPPGATNYLVTQTCPVPAGTSFWRLTTSARKHATSTAITDGTAPVFMGTDWENPGAKLWASAPFFTFASGSMTWSCTYDNSQGTAQIQGGASLDTNEECLGFGYFFPATKPGFCVNHTAL